MKTRTRQALGIIATLAMTAVGCTKSTAPTAPTMVPTPASPMFNLHGTVRDSISRPVSDARVELADGPQAGQFATTDMGGQFAFAPFTASATTVTLRVTRDGYAPATYTVTRQGDSQSAVIFLTPLTRVNPTGEYQFTLTAAAACEALPPAVRTRKYTAVITGLTGSLVTLSGADLVPNYDTLVATPADNAVRFYLYSAYAAARWLEDDPIVERLDATSYVAFSATATVMPWNPDQSMAAVDGTIAYCAAAKEASAPIYPPTCLVPPVECKSSSHRLSLARR
jgi:Carboxypeptidase regulatory-like domain